MSIKCYNCFCSSTIVIGQLLHAWSVFGPVERNRSFLVKRGFVADTLHRFCKKEHDWGWKKFMELNKVLEGFTVNNTLVIKAQVQVIRYGPSSRYSQNSISQNSISGLAYTRKNFCVFNFVHRQKCASFSGINL
jgi:hypothetical protein